MTTTFYLVQQSPTPRHPTPPMGLSYIHCMFKIRMLHVFSREKSSVMIEWLCSSVVKNASWEMCDFPYVTTLTHTSEYT